MKQDFDILVIGAGIAGVSAASELAAGARVALIEAEEQPGYHATGRSAAILAQNYGSRIIRALTAASEPFLADPPDGFGTILTQRGLMRIARPDQVDRLRTAYDEMSADSVLEWVDAAGAEARVPILRAGHVAAGFINEAAADIDVHALLHGWLRRFRAAGGTLRTGTAATGLARRHGLWRVETTAGPLEADIVVNAAGAWADEVAALAGAEPVGLMPLRRTAITFDTPTGLDVAALPMVVDADEQFYLKPESGRLMASPADETPAAAADSRPEEIDIAVCVDRIQTAFDLDIRRIAASWSGLRSFVADRVPVCGYDSRVPGFFWLAAQGGYGVQTAPALAALTACLILGGAQSRGFGGLDPVRLAPARLQTDNQRRKGE